MALASGIDYSTLTYDGKPLPGQYFFCPEYRVTLNTEACAARHREAQANARWLEKGHKLFECVTCPIGHAHAGAENPMQPNRDTHCVRCGCGFQRLIDASLCISCYNRQREVVAGRNSKGSFPSVTGSQLFWARSIIRAGSECAPPLFGQTGLNGLPTLEALGDDCWWFDGVMSGREEFDRLLATRWAYATVEAFELSPSLLEIHRSTSH